MTDFKFLGDPVVQLAGAAIVLAVLAALAWLVGASHSDQMSQGWSGRLLIGHMVLVVLGAGASIYFSRMAAPRVTVLLLGVSLLLSLNAVWISARLYAQLMDRMQSLRLEMEKLNTFMFVDPMTGIYNRGYLDRQLEEAWAVAERNSTNLSLILFDIDDFKKLNDEAQSHSVGDRVLKDLSQFLLLQRRRGDLLARYGGDELAFISPTSLPGAIGFAERLRRVIEQEFQPFPESPGKRITCSFGVASKGYGAQTRVELVKGADSSLYKAKSEGKNRVVAHAAAA